MSEIAEKLEFFKNELEPAGCKLIPVSKTKPNELLAEAYESGNKVFGENKVQELASKYEALPKDIEWHFIGHLQRNKVKYIAPFVHLIHAVDSLKLLREINKEGAKNNRVVHCLLQVHIAQEESKFGFSPDEVIETVNTTNWKELDHIQIDGIMAMATFTSNLAQVKKEFRIMKDLKHMLNKLTLPDNVLFKELSIGMTNDYKVALEEGSTMVRIGTAIFGAR